MQSRSVYWSAGNLHHVHVHALRKGRNVGGRSIGQAVPCGVQTSVKVGGVHDCVRSCLCVDYRDHTLLWGRETLPKLLMDATRSTSPAAHGRKRPVHIQIYIHI